MTQRSDVTIRRANASDIPAIARLERLCFSAPWSEDALGGTMAREQALFLVAEAYGEVCGYIGSYYVLDEGYITNVATDPRYRRSGIGRALVAELAGRGRALSLSFWTLEVRVSNESAIALYKSMGFESVGRRPRFYSNPCEDAELMTLYLGKG